VTNVARANYLACAVEKAAGGVFNIAGEHTVSVNELARQLVELAGRDVKIVHDPPMVGDIRHSSSDITRARELLGYEPSVGFADGLKRTFDYFASQARAV
jgi:UDP-glucose 4-epimerase